MLKVKTYFTLLLFCSSVTWAQVENATPIISSLSGKNNNKTFNVKLISQSNAIVKTDLEFSSAPRLKQIIESSFESNLSNAHVEQHSSGDIYWEGARLFAANSNSDLLNLQESVALSFTRLNTIWKNQPYQLAALLQLQAFFKKSTFKPVITNKIELDKILVGQYPDPLIQQNAILVLPKSPQFILLAGEVANTQPLNYKTAMTVADYLAMAKVKTLGIDSVQVITPNGELEKHNIAYWNKDKTPLQPGSLIYIPFKNLPAKYQDFNQLIIRLLQQRVS